MKLAIVTNDEQKQEWLSSGVAEDCNINWLSSLAELPNDTEAVIDLLFEQNGYDAETLKNILPRPIIVSSVIKTIDEIGYPFIRLNGWPTFLGRKTAELACNSELQKKDGEKILALFNRKSEWVNDIKGFISARVVSMIINEAFFTLVEKVSTKDEIDTAMKLGTNYPYGPFEWAKKIGLKNIASLLSELSKTEKRYQPSNLLLKEAAD
jgi:3-hydroxybutyryl-CoA dehydrogenase